MIITQNGIIMRQAVKNISTIGRNTMGVRVIRLRKNDKVMDICRVIPEKKKEIPEETDDDDQEDDNNTEESTTEEK